MKTKILQFGEGNFLRCFIDWMVQKMNDKAGFDGSVVIVQAIGDELSPPSKILNERGGFYHTCLRGVEDGKPVEIIEENKAVEKVLCAKTDWDEIEKIVADDSLRFVVSNTTEAGIEYRKDADTFPFKVAKLLKARKAANGKGLVFIPCELIEHNGDNLKKCVLQYVADWNDAELGRWIEEECVFCSTLVDRIVSGRPDDESAARYEKTLGERDEVLVCGEPFHFFVIEVPEAAAKKGFYLESELPLEKSGINVVYTPDMQPYRTRKVRFLNGAHTATVLEGHLAGFTFVDELVKDPKFNAYFRKILFEEIFPTIDLPEEGKRQYAESVLERFANPFANHRLLSIALNSVSKWKVRVLPTILDYYRMKGSLPEGLVKSLGSLIKFYRTDKVNDSADVMEFFKSNPSPDEIMRKTEFWGMDLTSIPGFADMVKTNC
jgi:tagaturonate reductase